VELDTCFIGGGEESAIPATRQANGGVLLAKGLAQWLEGR